KKDFRVPRALICAKSEYFEAAFLNEVKETQTRVLDLAEDADVTHAMMKLFITWLHTGLVYADEMGGIPAIASDYGYIAAP
ncbi:UNVERIFIED_CONTAM: BTB/POZ domain-containing protein, partial [Bacteroidetes bacterium 56_B9]